MLPPLLSQIEASGVAISVGRSVLLTGVLGGLHLVGMTLVLGGVVLSTLRLLGLLLPRQPVADVTGAARRGIVIGLALSVTTGLLLLSPRVSAASANHIFQLKMVLLAAAVTFHVAIYRGAAKGPSTRVRPAVAGASGLLLWSAVLLAGIAFILIE